MKVVRRKTTLTRRYRKPKMKDGELRVYWGKLPYDSPDIIYAWQGDPEMSRDTRLLHNFFSCESPDPFAQPLWSKMYPSFVKELEQRGYDITTLKFSIMKKKVD